jgi:hypothetical protein
MAHAQPSAAKHTDVVLDMGFGCVQCNVCDSEYTAVSGGVEYVELHYWLCWESCAGYCAIAGY